MKNRNVLFEAAGLKRMALMTAVLLAGAAMQTRAGASGAHQEQRAMATGSKFYCNIKALNPSERAHHKQLTDKIIATRAEIVESERGYEFQFKPQAMSIAELADWVVAEGKCCPFFDFHIDLEREGSLVCLRLTGAEGIKEFIRTEFQVSAK